MYCRKFFLPASYILHMQEFLQNLPAMRLLPQYNTSPLPVSYTHLDVYKRQPVTSAILPSSEKFTITVSPSLLSIISGLCLQLYPYRRNPDFLRTFPR